MFGGGFQAEPGTAGNDDAAGSMILRFAIHESALTSWWTGKAAFVEALMEWQLDASVGQAAYADGKVAAGPEGAGRIIATVIATLDCAVFCGSFETNKHSVRRRDAAGSGRLRDASVIRAYRSRRSGFAA
jgi:hypothetical protein